MYGAILGDIIGSPYEFDRGDKTKDFPLFSDASEWTDDTVMTLAVAEAFYDAMNVEDAIRNAVSLGGDCDTLTCITGSVAEAFYGIPEYLKQECRDRLPRDLREALTRFDEILDEKQKKPVETDCE